MCQVNVIAYSLVLYLQFCSTLNKIKCSSSSKRTILCVTLQPPLLRDTWPFCSLKTLTPLTCTQLADDLFLNSGYNSAKSKTGIGRKGEARLTLVLAQCVGPAVGVHDIGVAWHTSLTSSQALEINNDYTPYFTIHWRVYLHW